MKRNVYSQFIVIAALLVPMLAGAQAQPQTGPQGFNFDGKLVNPDGTAMVSASIPINVKIYNAAKTCLLYEENNIVDTTVTGGAFSIQVGSPIGSAKRSGNDPGQGMAAIFQNRIAIPAYDAGGCAGSTFTPVGGEKRFMRVTVNSNVMSPDFPIEATPFAITAETLRGMTPADFVGVNASANLTQANLEGLLTGSGLSNLSSLVAGTSSLYMKAAPNTNVSFGGYVIQNVGNPVAGTDATNKNYVDTNVGGKSVDFTGVAPGVGGGKTIIWDQGQNKWVVGDASLPVSGGTMAGAIAMSGFNITNIGHMTMAPQRTLNLGTYSAAQESGLSLSAGDAGKIWYNTSSNSVNYWNGSAVQSMGGGGGITALTGDVVASGSGSVAATISNNAINTAKMFAPVGVNRLVMTDPTTGNSLVPFTCSTNEVPYWTAGGWACTSIAGISNSLNLGGNSTGQPVRVGTNDAFAFLFKTNNVERMGIDMNGNVGIGTTSPARKFHIGSTAVRIDPAPIPGTPGPGDFVFDSGDLNKFKYYNGSNWVVLAGAGGDFMANGSVPMNAQFLAWAGGTNTNPGITFAGDTDTGLYSAGVDTIGFSSGGNVSFKMSNAGFWGAVTGSHMINPNASSLSNPTYGFNGMGGNGISMPSAGNMQFVTTNIERMRIDSSGNVGVGTATPAMKLDVIGQVASRAYGASPGQTGQIILGELAANGTDVAVLRASDAMASSVVWTLPPNDGANGTVLMTNGSGALSWGTPASVPGGGNGTIQFNSSGVLTGTPTLMWDTVNGRLGVGTGSPSAKLEVAGSDATTTTMKVRGFASQTADLFQVIDGSAAIKMQVASNGNVGIGTTTAPAQMLEVGGDVLINGLRLGKGNGGSATSTAFGFQALNANAASSNTAVGYQALFSTNSGNTNSAFGDSALRNNTGGAQNTAMGWQALYSNTTGSTNVAVGRNALYSAAASSNTAVGTNAGSGITTGGNNTLLGYNSGSGLAAQNNTMVLGSFTGASMANNEISISTSGTGIERLRISAGGDVGLGTSTPTDRLHIVSTGSSLLKLESPSQPMANMMFSTNSGQASVRLDTVIGNPSFQIDVGNNGSDLYVSNLGYVGVGNSSPAVPLHVNGAMVSSEKVLASGGVIDFAQANNYVLQSVGGTVITANNMVFGGVYRVIIQDATPRTYTFSGCSNSYFNPANGSTAGAQTIYTITYSSGGKCYIHWLQY